MFVSQGIEANGKPVLLFVKIVISTLEKKYEITEKHKKNK